ncbi:MAG: DUF5652 family protein [archaeon]
MDLGLTPFISQLNISPWLLSIILIWTLLWKAFACWKSARLNKPIWFIVLFLVNTLGILEILYIFIFSEYRIQGNGPAKKINRSRKKK